MDNRLRSFIIAVITLVWSANFIAPLFIDKYEPPTEIHIVFMAVMAAVIGAPEKKKVSLKKKPPTE